MNSGAPGCWGSLARPPLFSELKRSLSAAGLPLGTLRGQITERLVIVMRIFLRWHTNGSGFAVYLKDWEYCRRTRNSGVEGALVEWRWRRAEFLMN